MAGACTAFGQAHEAGLDMPQDQFRLGQPAALLTEAPAPIVPSLVTWDRRTVSLACCFQAEPQRQVPTQVGQAMARDEIGQRLAVW